MKTNLTKRLATLGIISICAVGALTGCATSSTTEPATPPKTETTAPEASTPSATSPMGQRPMINYNENRFVFLNHGASFELTAEQLGEQIAEQDSGVLFELKGYNPEFRMAFQYEDAFYIAENVSKSDDSAIDIAAFLEMANLDEHVVYADIFSHMGDQLLNNLSQEDAVKLLETMATGEVAELTNEEFEAIGKAQSEGDSFKVEFMLEDHTTYSIYIIPSMNYVSIGDYTCVVENLEELVGSHFENLEAPDDTIYN